MFFFVTAVSLLAHSPFFFLPFQTQDGVGAGSEFVTLGEDPYSDYTLSGIPRVMQYPGEERAAPSMPQFPPLSAQEDPTNFDIVHDAIAGIPADLTEALAADVLEGDPCDPYF